MVSVTERPERGPLPGDLGWRDSPRSTRKRCGQEAVETQELCLSISEGHLRKPYVLWWARRIALDLKGGSGRGERAGRARAALWQIVAAGDQSSMTMGVIYRYKEGV